MTKDEEAAAVPSQTCVGLGTPGAKCYVCIFFRSRSKLAVDGHLEPHPVVSAMHLVIILLTVETFPAKVNVQTVNTYKIQYEGFFHFSHHATSFILGKARSVTDAKGIRAW